MSALWASSQPIPLRAVVNRPHRRDQPVVSLPMADGDIPDIRNPRDRDVAAMRVAYRDTGGTARSDNLARLLANHQPGRHASLSELVISGRIFSFEWHDVHWIPMFQFELRDLSVHRGARKVVTELGRAFDGWSLAVWFAYPNSWLGHRAPVELLDWDLPVVLDAARADRYIANG